MPLLTGACVTLIPGLVPVPPNEIEESMNSDGIGRWIATNRPSSRAARLEKERVPVKVYWRERSFPFKSGSKVVDSPYLVRLLELHRLPQNLTGQPRRLDEQALLEAIHRETDKP